METEDNLIIKKNRDGEMVLKMKPVSEPTLPVQSKRDIKMKEIALARESGPS